LVSIDDGEPFEVELAGGTTDIVLPEPRDASRVRVLLTQRFGTGMVRITDIGLPRLSEVSVPPRRCHVVGTIDGRPLSVELTGDIEDLVAGRAVPFQGCSGPVSLARGGHILSSVPDFSVDALHLSAVTADRGRQLSPPMEVRHHSTEVMRLVFPAGCTSCLVSSGQAYDPRWVAQTGDGVSLGPPTIVDGYAAGWRIDVDPDAEVEIRFGPSRSAGLAWWVSLATLLTCAVVLVVHRRTTVRHRDMSEG
jgi:arabinofuranan 3-O-arabinosyltransferase